MPVLSDLSLNLSFDEAVKYHGLRCRGLIRPKTLSVLKSLIDDIEQHHYFKPQIAYQVLTISEIKDGFIYLTNKQILAAPIAFHYIKKASHLLLAVGTLGSQISCIISELFHNNKKFNAILVEELANYALFKVSMMIEKQADIDALNMSLTASGPLSPGDEGFKLSSQPVILKLAGASLIDVAISSTQMMAPQHSISVVYGIGQKMRKWSQSKNCETCKSRNHCQHRIALLAMEESP